MSFAGGNFYKYMYIQFVHEHCTSDLTLLRKLKTKMHQKVRAILFKPNSPLRQNNNNNNQK